MKWLTGNVLGLIDSNGNSVIQYNYTAFGEIIDIRGPLKSVLEHNNPFLYKGYYYDVETSLYYCNSRYYNPEWGRWISADDVSFLDPSLVNGLNLYAYCGNNPVMYTDPSGCFWDTVFDMFSLAWSIHDVIRDPKDWKNWAWLAADIAFLIIPFIPSIMAKTNKISDAAFTVSKFDDAFDSIVIGNNMGRVTSMAMDTGSLVYRGFDALNALDNASDATKALKAAGKVDNARWLMDKFYKGYNIIDVGKDSRTFLQFWKSAYGMERRLLFFLRYGNAISIGGRVITRGIREIW